MNNYQLTMSNLQSAKSMALGVFRLQGFLETGYFSTQVIKFL